MAMYDYGASGESKFNSTLDSISYYFTGFFIVELLLKIVGLGFCLHRNSYMRDPWNWIDFIAVVIGSLEFIPGLPNLKVLRTLRVIRPLRSIKAVPSMRRQVTSLLNSLPALANVVVFLLFMFILFGILGMQLFQGKLYSRCRLTPEPIDGVWPADPTTTDLCKTDDDC